MGIPNLTYVGNHGLEVASPDLSFVHPQAVSAKNLVEKIKSRLKLVLKPFRGVLIEDKVFALGIHYRKLPVQKVTEARNIFEKAVRPYVRAGKVGVFEGKKVWELRPTLQWNKGTTVLWLYGRVLAQTAEEKILPIYIGDDRTDEDAFRSLKPVGLSVKVALDEAEALLSDADYYLKSPAEVIEFLERVKAVKIKSASLKSGLKKEKEHAAV